MPPHVSPSSSTAKLEQNETERSPPASSYPGIWKYPTNRGKPFRMAEDWLNSKREDDNIQDFWRVYDKLYDFSSFINRHPGGPEWLEMSRGTDITEAFEASHVVNTTHVEKTLAKFYIRDCSPDHPRISPFTLKPDGFYMTLKRRVEPIFEKVGTGSCKTVLLMQDSLVLCFLLFAYIGVTQESILGAIVSGILLGLLTIGAHNFLHMKENWRRYYFDLSLLSSFEWRITHAFSHHLYPNTVMDMELQLFPDYEYLPNRKKHWFQRKFAVLYGKVFYFSGFWIDLGKRIYHISKGMKELRKENLLPFIELIALIVVSGGNFGASFKTWFIFHTVSSFVLLQIGATAAHHHPEIFHDGDEPLPDPDFGIGQLDATRDRAESIFQTLFVSLITFGQHPLHHLFPTVCHSKLHYIKPVFEQTVREFKLDYPGISQMDHYLGCYQQLARTEIRKRDGTFMSCGEEVKKEN